MLDLSSSASLIMAARPVVATIALQGERPDGANAAAPKIEQYCAITRAVAQAAGARLVDLRNRGLQRRGAGRAGNHLLAGGRGGAARLDRDFHRRCLRHQSALPMVPGGSDLAGQTASTLTLNSVANAAAGAYAVQVSNNSGAVTSASAALTVAVGPDGAGGTYRYPVEASTKP